MCERISIYLHPTLRGADIDMISEQTTYHDRSDSELLALLKQGNHTVYAEIYHRYKKPIYVHAYSMLGDSQAARDIVQELFAQLWIKREELNIDRNLSAYLYTAARNRVLDCMARNQREGEYLESLQDFSETYAEFTDYRVRERELINLIEKEVSALPPKMRVIFELSRHEQLSHREIADQLEISEKTVKKQINNALKVLRVKLGEVVFLLSFTEFML
jgi:RNA polymerase sigma-70 factor (family 1)